MIAVLLTGCGGLDSGASVRLATVEIRGVPAGSVRMERDGAEVIADTTWRWSTGDVEQRDRFTVDADGRVLRVGELDVADRPLLLDIAGGVLADPNVTDDRAWVGGETRAVTFARGSTVEWTSGRAHGRIGLDGEQVMWIEEGPVKTVWDQELAIDPIDPTELLAVPSPAIADARRARKVDFTFDGQGPIELPGIQTIGPGTVTVESPIRDEIPAEDLKRVRVWVDTTRYTNAPKGLLGAAPDCESHARALVEAVRAEGVPAYEVIGILASDEPGMRAHAWAVIELHGRAIPVDPSFEEPIADAARIALARDDVDAPWVVLDALASMQVREARAR